MRRLASAFVALSLGVACLASAADAPTSAAKLAERLTGGGDVAGRREAAYQLGALGPDAKAAIPALIKALEDPDKQVWSLAIAALAAFGPEAKDAVPVLLAGLDSRKVRGGRERDRRQMLFRSAYALSRIGTAALPQLIEALQGDDSWLRAGAAKALGGIGPAAREASPALVMNLGRQDADERRETIDALGQIGQDTVPALTPALDSKDVAVRTGAALALAQIGPAAAATAPRIAELAATEPDPACRAALLGAVARVGVEPGRAVDLLIQGVKDEREPVRHAAVNAIYLMRAANDRLIPALSALLRDPNPALVERGALVLGRLGPAASGAVPAILAAARQRNPMPPVFFSALAEIGPKAVSEILKAVESESPDALQRDHWSVKCLVAVGGQAVEALAKALSSSQSNVRLVAARSLGELGPLAAGAFKELLVACRDADPGVRAAALRATVGARVQTVAAAARVEAALQDPSPVVRAAGADLIPHLGEQAKPLAPALLAAITDPDQAVRAAVVQSLASFGGIAAPVLPQLVEILPKSDAVTRARILNVFASVGPAAKATLPSITACLHEPDADVRAAAVGAFGKIASPAEAVPLLRTALDDPSLPVRKSAAQQLGDLGDKARESADQLTALLDRPEERDFAFDALRKISVRSVPSLVKLLSDHDLTVQIFACQRLGKLGAEAKDAVPALEAIASANRGREELKKNARDALKKIQL